MKRRGLSGPAILAIITSTACLLAIVSVVVMLGFLPADEAMFVPTRAQ